MGAREEFRGRGWKDLEKALKVPQPHPILPLLDGPQAAPCVSLLSPAGCPHPSDKPLAGASRGPLSVPRAAGPGPSSPPPSQSGGTVLASVPAFQTWPPAPG